MRKNRILIEGAEYHVTAKINRSENIFLSEEDRVLFMSVFRRAKKKYNFTISNFCIMSNHIHLLIKPGPGESLSKIMQWLLGVFAQVWNKKHNLSGHLWGERFFSRIIIGFLDFIRVFTYIDYNPVIAGIVGQPEQWMYGGLWHHKKGVTDITCLSDVSILEYFPEHKFRK
jgi:putative transposase